MGQALIVAASLGVTFHTATAQQSGQATLDGLSAFTEGAYAEAMGDWRAGAAAGEAGSALYLGVTYDVGAGVEPDVGRALAWYKRAAALGSATAAFNVAVMYDAGPSGRSDPAMAARWYELAARRGYARADYNLALLYESGTGVKRDRQRADELFRVAARLGLTAGWQHLQAPHPPASLQPQPPPKQPTLQNQSDENAMTDFQRAQAALLDRSPAKAVEAAALFRRAADRHDPMAQYDLGYCYESGIGVPKSAVEAHNWYRRALTEARDPDLQAIARAGLTHAAAQLTAEQRANVSPGSAPSPTAQPIP